MDRFDFRSLHGIRLFLQRGVRSLSKHFDSEFWHSLQALVWRQRKRWAGAFLLIGSLGLGVGANLFSQAEALSGWERAHFPSEKLFQKCVKSLGLRQLEDARQLHRILRTMPVYLDQGGTIWTSADFNWIAYFADPEKTLQVQVYCLDCSSPPKRWNPQGRGWNGFENTIEMIEKMVASHRAIQAPGKKAIKKDPREVIY
jgi:hypothetical protein